MLLYPVGEFPAGILAERNCAHRTAVVPGSQLPALRAYSV